MIREARFNEAGAISPRMRRQRRGHAVEIAVASMRPGRYRPGCFARHVDFFDSGVGFNEAGAISPRMQRWEQRASRPRRRFNEAGAISPRMRARGRDRRADPGAASMRPGRYRPG